MKKALLYALTLALALLLTACGQPKAEQPTDPAPNTSAPEIAPEQTPAAPVETEDTQPPEETDPQEEPMKTEPTEPVEVAEPPTDTAPEQLAGTAPETPAEKPQEVILPEPPKTEAESKPSQESVSPPPAQQEPAEQQPQQPSDESDSLPGIDLPSGTPITGGQGSQTQQPSGSNNPLIGDRTDPKFLEDSAKAMGGDLSNWEVVPWD